MSAPHIILASLPSLCQKLSELVKMWRSYNKNNFAWFFLRHGVGCYDGLIGSRIRAFDWNQNQRPWMTLNGVSRDCPKLRVKLWTSNLDGTVFIGAIRTKAHLKFLSKWSVGVSRDCPKFLSTPLLSPERVKLRTSNFVRTFIRSITTKAH